MLFWKEGPDFDIGQHKQHKLLINVTLVPIMGGYPPVTLGCQLSLLDQSARQLGRILRGKWDLPIVRIFCILSISWRKKMFMGSRPPNLMSDSLISWGT